MSPASSALKKRMTSSSLIAASLSQDATTAPRTLMTFS
jgi:hypothetical protein